MANDYTVTLKAILDTSGIQKQLEQVSKNNPLNLSSSSSSSASANWQKQIDDAKRLDKVIADSWQKQLSDARKLDTVKADNIQKEGKMYLAAEKIDKEFDAARIKSQNEWQESIKSSIGSVIKYAATIGILYSAFNQLKEGIQYVVDLNKQMTNVQLVTGQSSESLGRLATQYNKTAKELGTTTLEVAKSSLEFIRQGKTAEETAILIRSSTELQKLGNMDAADATEKLTSIMNGFKIEAKDTGVIVDKLVKLLPEHIVIYGKINIDKNINLCYN